MRKEKKARVLVLENSKAYEIVGSYWSFDIGDSLSDSFFACHADGIGYISESCDELRDIVHRVECEKAVDEWWEKATVEERERYMSKVDDDWDHSLELCGIELPEVNLDRYESDVEFTKQMTLALLEEHFLVAGA